MAEPLQAGGSPTARSARNRRSVMHGSSCPGRYTPQGTRISLRAEMANVMARAASPLASPTYHPHDLCHRRLSLWHAPGSRPANSLRERVPPERA